MKKLMRRLLAVVAAITMIFTMGAMPAMAEEGTLGNITVNGAIKDATYTAYKVFDATYSDGAVSYTLIDNGVKDITGFDTVFTTSTNGDKTYVQKKNGVEDATVINWLKSHESDIAVSKNQKGQDVTNSQGAASIILATGEAGYYFITATIGTKGQTDFKSAVTIDTAHPDAVVNSKIEDKPSYPNDAKTVSTDGTNYVKVNTMEVGQTAQFRLKFNATNYTVDDKGNTTLITEYTVTDTVDGFTISNDQLTTLTVKVGNATLNRTESDITSYYTVNQTSNGFTLVIHNYNKGNYTSPSLVTIDYSATLTNKNVVSDSTNKFSVDKITGDQPETHTYNYKIDITKYDASTVTKNGDGSSNYIKATKLSGAQFVLKNAENKYYKVDTTTGVVSWGDQKDATVVTTDKDGKANFQGLKAGSYTLVETKAPDGYTLAKETTVILTEANQDTTVASLTVASNVEDTKGSELPSTGGMGTTIFYALGAALVIGAGVVLVTRRRLSK